MCAVGFEKPRGKKGLGGDAELADAGDARQMKVLGDTWRGLGVPAMALLGLLGCAARSVAGEAPVPAKLKAETREAFDRYVQLTNARNDAELKQGHPLLWIDGLPASEREAAYAELRKGQVELKQLETRENGEALPCPGGMIHHWAGVVFIPGAKLGDVLGVLEDYDRQAIYYAPDVEQARIQSRDGDHFRIFLRFRRHKVITVVLDTEHEVQYFHDSPALAHSRSSAVRIAQVKDAGKKAERKLAPGDDEGFLWGMETWWRMEERDGGVYVQSEVASLTRNIPAGLGWLIGPFVSSVPKESLTFTMKATRKAVQEKTEGTK